jgi:CBS domain-containing protein
MLSGNVRITMKKLTTADVKVSRIMTKNLITVPLGTMVEEAVRKMVDFDVECIPVVDSKGILHGLLTFRDIVTKVIYSQTDVKGLKVEDIMAKDLVTCNLNCTVLDVVKLMKNKNLRRIPVVDAENKLMGLVTDFDLALFGWDFK